MPAQRLAHSLALPRGPPCSLLADGRTWYAYVLFVYILQVLAVAALPVLRSSKALEGVAHGYRDMPSVLILAVGGVLGILLELLQFFNGHRGKIGYFWRDGPNLCKDLAPCTARTSNTASYPCRF